MTPEFDPREYSDRYEFRGGRVYRKTTGRRLVWHHNPATGYSFYRLTRNDGKRVSVSTALVSGKTEKVGDLYVVSGGTGTPNTEFPAYLFDRTKCVVWRVAFAQPRRSPVRVRPDKSGRVRLRDFKGDTVTKHVDDLFT